jgi:hypothetical protein
MALAGGAGRPVVGVILTLAGNYGRQLVHDQLAAQKIKFAPYDESG